MKKIFPVLCALLALSVQSASAQDFYNRQLEGNRDMVKQQYASDIEKKEAILRKMREFIGEINGRLKQGSSTKIDVPIDIEAVSDIKPTDRIHTRRKCRRGNMRISSMMPRIARKAKAGARRWYVCLRGEGGALLQSEEMETVNGVPGPWLMVRRAGGEEGWIFSSYLSKEKPGKRIKKEAVPPPVAGAPVRKKARALFTPTSPIRMFACATPVRAAAV